VINFQNTAEVVQFTQQLIAPSVYLDHWALRVISESEILSSRLSHALKLSGGTFALSWLNVVEFTKVTDEAQRNKADLLLNSITPNVFWLNPDFWTVAKHERLAPPLAGAEAPYSDLEMAALLIANGLYRPASTQVLGPQSHFAVIQRLPGILAQYDEFADDIVAQITELRRDFDNRKEMRAAIKAPLEAPPHSPATNLIARHLIAPFLKDKLRAISRNNAIDLTHAVVPVSYCDYVLLDGQWSAMVNDLRHRLADAGVSIPIAKVFSKRGNGIEGFLAELERRAAS
jgi:hypothetical protein